MKMLPIFGLLLAWVAGLGQDLVPNGAMEGPFRDGLAGGWVANCYGSNAVAFTAETANVHEGKSAQRVTCTRFEDGGVQFHSGDIALQKGQAYTLRLWLKGDVSVPVYVGLRQHGAPYTPYLKRDLRVKPDWTPYLIQGQASESDARCGLYFMFAGTGTLLVDGVSLQPGLQEDGSLAVAGPVQKGNRIYNSGFEAGPEGWTPVGGFVLDEQVAHSGRRSARLEAASGNREGVECRPFPVRAGRRYTLSAWIRAAEPMTKVRLRLFEWADQGGDFPENRHERETTIQASTGWARYELSGLVLPNLHEGYVARIVPSGRIWLDEVQVEEGDLTAYQPAQPLEVGAATATRWCRAGDLVEVSAWVAGGSPANPVALDYTLEDLWSRRLTKVVHQATPGEADRASFRLPQAGMYRVRVRANASPASGEVWFGVFPERDRRERPDSPFGTHVTSQVPEPSPALLASAAMGARWVRLHDFGDFCHWWRVEPEPGRWTWYDQEVDALRQRGFQVFANLGHPPKWAGREPDQQRGGNGWTPAPPRALREWEQYVTRTVEHYRGRIRYWEVWNEPYWIGFFTGTPEEYAELLQVACRAIKRADPEAVVVGGCFTPTAEDWTQRVLAAGALKHMDALSYHVYWSPPMTEPGAADEVPLVARQVQRFRELMRQRGQVKPIFMSEGGIRCPPFASWLPADGFERSAPFGSSVGAGVASSGLDAAAGLVRGMTEMLSAGVQGIFYYYSGHERGAMPWFSTMANGYYVLLDYDGRPKPTMMAYSALEAMLGDAKPDGVTRRDGLTIHAFARSSGAVAVVWSPRARTLPLPAGAALFDLMGNALSSATLRPGEPVYVVASGLKPAQLQSGLARVAASAPASASAPAPGAAARPNILWLVSEDNDRLLGCYGDPLARTPTLDKLAREGVLYERCFAQPVCAPSRFTLITGMYAASHGPAQHMRAQGKIPTWLKGFPARLREAGYFVSNNSKTDYNAPIRPWQTWNESSKTAHWRHRPSPQTPFFSVFNHEVTHESCLFPSAGRRLPFAPTDPAKVRLPPYQPDTPEIRADWARYYDCLALMDGQVAIKLKDLAEDGLAEDTIVFYFSDNGGVLPRSKRFLQESGTHVPLIVYFPPKWRHLAPAAPGSRLQEPVSFVDFAPTVLSLAGVKLPDYLHGRAFLGAARSAPNDFVFLTRDRMDERYDLMRSVADARWVYIHNYRPDLPYVQPLAYMFQARGYQSWARLARAGQLTPATGQFWGQKPTEELYDSLADPDNVKNLAGEPAHRATLERMRAALKQRVLELKDNGFLPEGSALEGYDASHRPGAYPVERVLALANLASERNPANLPQLIAALDDPCEPIRWWAAQGCAMLRAKAAPAAAALGTHVADPSGAVQVAVAEALARLGQSEVALPILKRWVAKAGTPVALQAANVLDRLGELARPALPELRQWLQSAGEEAEGNAEPYLRRILEHTVAVLEGQELPLVYPAGGQTD